MTVVMVGVNGCDPVAMGAINAEACNETPAYRLNRNWTDLLQDLPCELLNRTLTLLGPTRCAGPTRSQ